MNIILNEATKKIKALRKDADIIEDIINDPSLIDWIEGCVIELREKFPSWDSEDIEPHFSVTDDNVTLAISRWGGSSDIAYDEILNTKGAKTNYSGVELTYSFIEKKLFTNIKLNINFGCKIPKEDIEFLKTMEKIVEGTTKSTHSVC